VPPSLIITESDGQREDHDIFSTTTDFERTAFGAFATVRRDERASVDEGDLLIVMLFVAIGLLLTAIFFTGSFAEFGQILSAAG
jgi:hypothetical protein